MAKQGTTSHQNANFIPKCSLKLVSSTILQCTKLIHMMQLAFLFRVVLRTYVKCVTALRFLFFSSEFVCGEP